MSTGSAFHDRLLELVPVYTEAGQRLGKFGSSAPPASDDQAVAYVLADRACRLWLRSAIPPNADMPDAIAGGLENLDPVADASTAMEAVEIARDARVIAEPLPGLDEVVATARLAEGCARAAARGDYREAGQLAPIASSPGVPARETITWWRSDHHARSVRVLDRPPVEDLRTPFSSSGALPARAHDTPNTRALAH